MNNEEEKRILEYLGWCRPCFDVNCLLKMIKDYMRRIDD